MVRRSGKVSVTGNSKKREPDYMRLLGDRYPFSIRSILRAAPGHVLVESDYTGAELYMMAMLSSDEQMLEHCQRNNLPEDHPDHYDIHSNVCVKAFRLKCPPTKKGLESIGKEHLRIVAKAVIFGIAYGRGAKAIALEAREQNVKISAKGAQSVIDAIFRMYSGLEPFFELCRERVTEERWLCNSHGRFRRVPVLDADDFRLRGDFERQLMNFLVQSGVASVMNRAMDHFYQFREKFDVPDLYRIALQMHDAAILEVPVEHVDVVVQEVMPYCMQTMVPIYPCDPDGMPNGTGPFRLGIDTEVSEFWGEKLYWPDCDRIGISRDFGKDPSKKKG